MAAEQAKPVPKAPELSAHLAAFGALIHRYTGADELVIALRNGQPSGGCRCPLTLGEAVTTGELLRQASAALGQASEPSQSCPTDAPARFEWMPPALAGAARTDLCLFPHLGDGAGGDLRGTSALSPHAAPAAVLSHFQALLRATRAGEDVPVGEVPLLSEAERQAALDMGRGPARPELLKPLLLHEVFEATADAHGRNVAAVCGPEQVTYVQLEQRANRLARHLRKIGVQRGAVVALLLPRELDVYAAMLGILKAGAAYVPLDDECPPDRVAYILDDCKVSAVVTTSALADKHNLDGRRPVLLDRDGPVIDRQPAERLDPAQTQVRPGDLCYVIYTSGSTGRPKGVQIEHRSAAHLVLAERVIYGVNASDRVFQGFSVAFDASVEEIWLAFATGATLVAGSAEMVRAGPSLPGMLAAAGVTVLSTVPTLLSMLSEDVPTLRVLILGGETCPPDLLRRWYRPGRRVFNTYGPTEATVIATYTACEPDRPVTIGRPVPNYRVYVLDRRLQPVPTGAAGELCIGGAGLARGYLGRADLTAERFLDDPFDAGPAPARLYRTGDLARFTADGQLEYLGRIDTQAKIRGYRVELAEIESVLAEHSDIQAAVVALHREQGGDRLVGYVLPRPGRSVDERAIGGWLRTRLPAYMIPAVLETVTRLPTLPSGKIDRNRLPAPRPRELRDEPSADAPQGPAETRIVKVWQELFAPLLVSRTDDFFLDLGGHSLLAARMVSQLRQDDDFADLSVTDVYNFPTPRALAAELVRRQATRPAAPPPGAPARPVSGAGYALCCLGQAVGLYLIVGVFAWQWLAPYLVYAWLTGQAWPVVTSIALALTALLAFYPATVLLSVVVKWTVIGRYRPGEHRLWGWYYLRWWLVEQFVSALPLDSLAGTPLLAWYYRLMGARVGRNVFFGTDNVRCFDLIRVGDDSSIGFEGSLAGCVVENGLLKLGPTVVGRRCFVGTRSILGIGTRLEDDAALCDLSLLPAGQSIPPGQRWIGSPARPLDPKLQAPLEPIDHPRKGRRAGLAAAHALGVLILPAAYLLAIFPGVVLLNWASRQWGGAWFLLLAPAVAVSFVVLLSLGIAVAKWLLLGRVAAGTHSLASGFYFRKWFFDRLMNMSLDLLGPLYATLYVLPWYRLLGARVGQRAEISIACAAQPDLLELGEGGFIADCVTLGAPRVDRGRITLAPVRLGKRAFVGNSALVGVGTTLGDDTLIGCLSTPPLPPAGAGQNDTSWLGSPAIFLPQRQKSAAFPAESTFRPSPRLYAQRLWIEFFRVTLPATCSVGLVSALIVALTALRGRMSPAGLVALLPLLYLACGVAAALLVVAAKWALMGVYRPGERPLWSTFVWKTELLTALHEHLANPFLVELLRGTPGVCWFFRLLGARIGGRVFMDTTSLTEFDLIRVGDGAMLNDDCTIQTHLFEDRVMKMSRIDLGRRCAIGPGSIVLYDTRMEDGSSLGGLSLLMKGERLPAGTCWEGSPARRTGPGLAGRGGAVRMPPSGDQETFSPPHSAPGAAGDGDGVAFLSRVEDSDPDRAVQVWVLNLDSENNQSGALEDLTQPRPLTGAGADRQELRHALTRYLVGRCLNVPPGSVALTPDAHGRLSVTADGMPLRPPGVRLDVNTSHSGNSFVVAISRTGRVGVDVEAINGDFDARALADGVFCPAERQWLGALPPARRAMAFCQCWTVKEALAKAIGQGACFGLDRIETALDATGAIRLVSLGGSAQLASGWKLTQRVFHTGDQSVVVAVAAG